MQEWWVFQFLVLCAVLLSVGYLFPIPKVENDTHTYPMGNNGLKISDCIGVFISRVLTLGTWVAESSLSQKLVNIGSHFNWIVLVLCVMYEFLLISYCKLIHCYRKRAWFNYYAPTMQILITQRSNHLLPCRYLCRYFRK